MSWFSKAIDSVGGVADWIGDTADRIHLTDSEAPQRAADTAARFNKEAADQLDRDMAGSMSMFSKAAQGRDLGTNLTKYGEQANRALDLNWNSLDAGSADNVREYLNPKMDDMLQKTMQNVQGGAGAALQSSAATRTGANAVAQQFGNMWDTAFDQSMKDSQNNQGIAMQGEQVANRNLQEQNAPALNWAGLGADLATTKYGGTQAVGEAATTAAGQRNTIL